jgi:hypothetical protein
MADLTTGLKACRVGTSPPPGLIKKLAPVLLTNISRQGAHGLMMIGAHRRCRFGQTGQFFKDQRGLINALESREAAQAKVAVILPDIVQILNALYIDKRGWRFDPVFHIDQQVGSPGQYFSQRFIF